MKNILLFSVYCLCLCFAFQVWAVEVQVTEPIPGANCYEEPDSKGIYTCNIQPGFESVMLVAGEVIKYFTYITSLACVLFIVINGILYSMAGLNDGLKTSAKDRITKTLIGLVILMLSWVILNAIAPWIYR